MAPLVEGRLHAFVFREIKPIEVVGSRVGELLEQLSADRPAVTILLWVELVHWQKGRLSAVKADTACQRRQIQIVPRRIAVEAKKGLYTQHLRERRQTDLMLPDANRSDIERTRPAS